MSERDEAARQVAELGAAHDRIAAAMYTVDTHAAWAKLDGGVLSGRTQTVIAALHPQVQALWAYFGVLGDRLEQARALLAARRLGGTVPPELVTLLAPGAVGLDAAGLPVDDTTPPTSRVALAELAARSERQAAAVLAQLSDVDTSASAMAARYVEASAAVEAVARRAEQLGESDVARPLRAAAAEVERLDVGDPITAAPGGRLSADTGRRLAGLADAVARARAQLDEVAGVRDAYAQRRAALDAAVEDVAAAETAVARAYARAIEKIADPGLGEPPHAVADLRAGLASLDELHRRAEADATQWRRLATEVSTVETAIEQARAASAEQRSLADGLIARRDELRGRLEAYRAKAAARGRAEDERLAGLFARAHDLLFTAPCDLRAATRAVHTYQAGLVEPTGPRERSAVDD
jgi:hypothetical protein